MSIPPERTRKKIEELNRKIELADKHNRPDLSNLYRARKEELLDKFTRRKNNSIWKMAYLETTKKQYLEVIYPQLKKNCRETHANLLKLKKFKHGDKEDTGYKSSMEHAEKVLGFVKEEWKEI